MDARVVPAVYLRNLVQQICAEERVAPSLVLQGLPVSWPMLQDSDWLGTFEEQMLVYERVAALSSVPGLGFRSPSAGSLASENLLGALLTMAPSVGEALRKVGDFISLIGGLSHYQLVESGKHICVRTHPKYSTNLATHRLICEENLAI